MPEEVSEEEDEEENEKDEKIRKVEEVVGEDVDHQQNWGWHGNDGCRWKCRENDEYEGFELISEECI